MRADRVEDGHSATQNIVYWHLWRSGRQVKGSRSRFVQIGYGQLQAALGIDRSNVQDAIRDLQKKLSIRVLRPSTVGTATVYEIFSCEDILKNRRVSGMVWVRKFGTRRADFVSQTEIDQGFIAIRPLGLSPIPSVHLGLTSPGVGPAVSPPIGTSAGVGLTTTGAESHTPTGGVGTTPIQRAKSKANEQTSTTSRVIIDALYETVGTADDDAAARITADARRRVPDATNDEIGFYIRQQAARIKNSRIQNAIGFLITQVPKCFEGESFRRFRETISIQQGGEPAKDDLVKYERILSDPDASNEEREIARHLLGRG